MPWITKKIMLEPHTQKLHSSQLTIFLFTETTVFSHANNCQAPVCPQGNRGSANSADSPMLPKWLQSSFCTRGNWSLCNVGRDGRVE